MKQQVMLDLETLGTRPGSVIVSIGAVKFDHQKIFSEFYQLIDAADAQRCGLVLDAETVMWWLKRDEAARMEIADTVSVPLVQALQSFSHWLGDDAEVWGNGASFDNVLLASAYKQIQMPVPWKFWNDRCYRTMKDLHPGIKMEREGTHHNALDDARSQAKHLIRILCAIRPL